METRLYDGDQTRVAPAMIDRLKKEQRDETKEMKPENVDFK